MRDFLRPRIQEPTDHRNAYNPDAKPNNPLFHLIPPLSGHAGLDVNDHSPFAPILPCWRKKTRQWWQPVPAGTWA